MTQATVHVLLVEDNEVDVEAVRRAFRRERIANPLVVAQDGEEALALLRGDGGREPVPRPRVVLLDLNLPRMSGLDLLSVLRSDPVLNDTVVIVLTTSTADADVVGAYQHNVAGYIAKEHVGEGFMRLTGLLDAYWRVVTLPGDREA